MKDNLWERWMTKEDYELVTKRMTKEKKEQFNRGFDDPNQLMSLGAYGLIKTLRPEVREKRRKDIPELIEKMEGWFRN